MNLTIKLRPYELEALEYLDNKAPQTNKSKRPGIFWAVHEASDAIELEENLDWNSISRIRIDSYFSGEKYEDSAIIHLTVGDDEYETVAAHMQNHFNLTRPIQKAYCIRNIIKYALFKYAEVATEVRTVESNENIEEFKTYPIEKKLEAIYEELVRLRAIVDKSI